jgi:tetratricopeptide (TPR) repeat protein
MNNRQEAKEVLLNALRIRQAANIPNDALVAGIHEQLGFVCHRTPHGLRDAQGHYRVALSIYEGIGGEPSIEHLSALKALEEISIELGHWVDWADLSQKRDLASTPSATDSDALRSKAKDLAKQDPKLASELLQRARVLVERDIASTETLCDTSKQQYWLAFHKLSLTEILRDIGDSANARTAILEACDHCSRVDDEYQDIVRPLQCHIGLLLSELGELDKASAVLEEIDQHCATNGQLPGYVPAFNQAVALFNLNKRENALLMVGHALEETASLLDMGTKIGAIADLMKCVPTDDSSCVNVKIALALRLCSTANETGREALAGMAIVHEAGILYKSGQVEIADKLAALLETLNDDDSEREIQKGIWTAALSVIAGRRSDAIEHLESVLIDLADNLANGELSEQAHKELAYALVGFCLAGGASIEFLDECFNEAQASIQQMLKE